MSKAYPDIPRMSYGEAMSQYHNGNADGIGIMADTDRLRELAEQLVRGGHATREGNDFYALTDEGMQYCIEHWGNWENGKDKKDTPSFDSPIEQAFWDSWTNDMCNHSRYHLMGLIPQYPIGKYRVDFAHEPTKTVIELDGFTSHSSTDDIARDRKRQRDIEEQGWHVIRFGGKEVHQDALGCVIEAYNRILSRMPA